MKEERKKEKRNRNQRRKKKNKKKYPATTKSNHCQHNIALDLLSVYEIIK